MALMQTGLGMQLDGVAELVRQHAGDLVGGGGLLHQAFGQDQLTARDRERIFDIPVDHDHAHRHGRVGCLVHEALGQVVEGRAPGPSLALPHAARQRDDDVAPHAFAQVLRHQPRSGLQRLIIEVPDGADDGRHHHREHGTRPHPEQALPGRRQMARAGPQRASEGRVGDEQGIGAGRLEAQQHIARIRAHRQAAAQVGVGPECGRPASAGRQDLQALFGQSNLDAQAGGGAPVAQPALVDSPVRRHRHRRPPPILRRAPSAPRGFARSPASRRHPRSTGARRYSASNAPQRQVSAHPTTAGG